MKYILCYGDSNTYGYIPGYGNRYSKEERWTGILQEVLGEEYIIIEEGYNGRTTKYDDPVDAERNGWKNLRKCIETYKQVDVALIMLGSNDVKKSFGAKAEDSANNVGEIADFIKEYYRNLQKSEPAILIISPPILSDVVLSGIFDGEFDERSINESLKFSNSFKELAANKSLFYFDGASVTKPSYIDGLHLDPESHNKLAVALSEKLKEIMSASENII